MTDAIKAHDAAQAVADLQARVDALERAAKPWAMPLPNLADAISRLEPKLEAAIFDNIESLYEDATPDPYAAGYWIPHTGDECPLSVNRRSEFVEINCTSERGGYQHKFQVDCWHPRSWVNANRHAEPITHWRYADPIAAKAAYEAWASGSKQQGCDAAPEYPWHNHDGSDKCPVPKRRRGEMIEVRFRDGTTRTDNYCAGWTWEWLRQTMGRNIVAWRYTQPDTRKAKWGPWVESLEMWHEHDCAMHAQSEWNGDNYIRHRVRL